MSPWKPCKRRDFIKHLRELGFDGPFSGTKHQFMVYRHHRMVIPSNREYSIHQLKMLLHEVESIFDRKIKMEVWENL